MNAGRQKKLLEDAWIGDAVLSLYARRRILGEGAGVNSEAFERMTSNRFLAALGDPSTVEAELGRVYESEGLEAAFRWIESRIIPVFNRQEEKRLRAIGQARGS